MGESAVFVNVHGDIITHFFVRTGIQRQQVCPVHTEEEDSCQERKLKDKINAGTVRKYIFYL